LSTIWNSAAFGPVKEKELTVIGSVPLFEKVMVSLEEAPTTVSGKVTDAGEKLAVLVLAVVPERARV
jgi:hypothetical protein